MMFAQKGLPFADRDLVTERDDERLQIGLLVLPIEAFTNDAQSSVVQNNPEGVSAEFLQKLDRLRQLAGDPPLSRPEVIRVLVARATTESLVDYSVDRVDRKR